ncbi:MAG: hypothetical protein K2V38_15745, partial [Gemmataceae bacterium]|nr:hypothetical protein [Gemmataceae bacterium]
VMAGKTVSEVNDLVTELRAELRVLRNDFDALGEVVARQEHAQLRERLMKIESLVAVIDPGELVRLVATLQEQVAELRRWRDENASELGNEVATLQEQVAELKKWREESERRRWQLVVGVFLAVLTFSANLVASFLRKPG